MVSCSLVQVQTVTRCQSVPAVLFDSSSGDLDETQELL